ncbi:DUF4344 domain-containing metallopeptidase [Pseudotabrizicola sp. 4114]|uniref:DUF4344 domain-containing metallopeptidase n=1 Tax=Pseudotabrizicola sp. 4114 TaxID=2817731 RepID=UPI00285C069F|nr:hypothetical protein [Pseudorhodobacter sp. 4114]
MRTGFAGSVVAGVVALANPALAEGLSPDAKRFVEGNLIGTFYHEMGHALIDVLQLPVLGQEEDAADTLAVVLIHDLWEAEDAEWLGRATADYYYYTVDWSGDAADETEWWGVHGPDEQRYYTHVCLFYGTDPERLAELATEYELPEDRAEGCSEEFRLAAESWGAFLDEITLAEGDAPAQGLTLDARKTAPYYALFAEEVRVWNETFALPSPITVRIEACGEANAFYYSADSSITMCTEYVDWLISIAKEADL